MLKRATTLLGIAVVAAVFGFTGALRSTAEIAQAVTYVCLGLSLLSFLFCLFEEAEPAVTQERQAQPTPIFASQAGRMAQSVAG
jgi:uncharacterized membrane protein YtjA (UPF0391 family)